MSDETVLLSHDGPLAVVTINRPKALNALNRQTLVRLKEVISSLGASGARAVALTGAGDKAFVAGADIVEMKDLGSAEAEAFSRAGHETMKAIEDLPIPVIAAVNGFALGGGCELALACDFIYASENAQFGQPEVNLGVIPGFGGTFRLAHAVGVRTARELVYSGRRIKASEAQALGLVSKVVPSEELMGACRAFAETLQKTGPLAVGAAKSVLRATEAVSREEAIAIEASAFGDLFDSADQKEGMSAFTERRTAEFSGA
ncbi:MAG: enoyl-CoA hydratase/isomerase family protein [Myxococcales bacterium]|nr:enoyl-CoA hydratase/isomerase family protein [Myxococcales bacterium]